MTVEKSMTL